MIPIIIISINIPELDTLIQKYKGQKLTNDQVAELVSVACFVDENKVVQHNYNLNITDDLKELVSHYKTGGVAKQGRGVLDEYYTNTEIVDAVAFAKEIKQDIIDKKQQNTTIPMWDEKTDTVIDVVPQEIAKEIKEKQSVQPSLFDLPNL